MQKDFQRIDRLSKLMHREIALMFQTEVKDPRLYSYESGLVTVSDVEVTRDLAYAKVFVSVLSPDEEAAKILKVLNQAASFFRSQLARRIKIRKIPEISFHLDRSSQEGAKLSHLIDQALSEDERLTKHRDDK